MGKVDIKSLTYEELAEQLLEMGEKKFRISQIYNWLHVKMVHRFDEMTNLSLALRKKLEEKYEIAALEPVEVLVSKIDGTRKYLFRLSDGNVIESVLMRYHHGNSVCISTQAGCRMGCRFCASTLDGLARNLTAGEMLDEIYQISQSIGERISNVVLMGSGEPMDNFSNVCKFLTMISDEHGQNISQRNLTLSTCGLVPKIIELADKNLQITLAISLHAADDQTRQELMPIAKKYQISELISACRYYIEKTGRRITFEYSLVAGVNDNEAEARKLLNLVSGMLCHVNLIPVNPIKERDYKQSSRKKIEQFKNILEKNGINVTIRREMGRDINGACGQLRKTYLTNKKLAKEEEHEGSWSN